MTFAELPPQCKWRLQVIGVPVRHLPAARWGGPRPLFGVAWTRHWRLSRLQDRPVPLEIACPAVEGEEQQAVGPPATREGVAPLDLVTSESVPPDEVLQCAGTGGGPDRRHQ